MHVVVVHWQFINLPMSTRTIATINIYVRPIFIINVRWLNKLNLLHWPLFVLHYMCGWMKGTPNVVEALCGTSKYALVCRTNS